MPLLTTTIGAYPKPVWAPVPNPFDAQHGRWRPTPTGVGVPATDDVVAELDRATCEVVTEQAAIGVDVPTDGEVRRENYLWYHCRHLDGFDFTTLVDKVMRDGGWRDAVPVVTGPIVAGEPFLVRDWRVAQSATDRQVKTTMPGPLTVAASTADAFYGDERRRATDLADALNVEVLRLVAAGCRWIQIDEPVFARDPASANGLGIELLERCFSGVPPHVRRVVHICCGYPSTLDENDYPKADNASYSLLADALDAAPVDAISIEDAHRPNDLRLLERFSKTTVILGVIDIARSTVEPTEQIRDRLLAALDHIEGRRLMAAPDCGMAMLGRELAVAKLGNLVAATRSV